MNIEDIPNDKKPRERLFSYGANSLSDLELMQILIGSGVRGSSVDKVAQDVLSKCIYAEDIAQLSLQELLKVKGLGNAKACLIVAAVEFGLRVSRPKSKVGETVKTPKDIYDILKIDLAFKQQEQLYLLSLDSRNKLICKDLINIGGLTYLSVSPREILFMAFKRNAASIIIVHNHPSGDPTPSIEDINVTEKINHACVCIDIPLIDHVIIGNADYVSLKACGLLRGGKKIANKNSLKGGENFEHIQDKT